MNKILIDPHNCSREEFEELKEYLSDNSWDAKEIQHAGELEKLAEFKESFAVMVGTIEGMVMSIPQKGNTPSDCQRLCMHQAIKEFYYTVNGLKTDDLIPNEYS